MTDIGAIKFNVKITGGRDFNFQRIKQIRFTVHVTGVSLNETV